MNWWSRNKVKRILGVGEDELLGLTRSGLLGYTSATHMHADYAVRQYQQFGTQWEIDERYGPTQRVVPVEVQDNMLPIEGIGPQPPATQTHAYIFPPSDSSPGNPHEMARRDSGWLTHFYLFPNYWCFPNSQDMALVCPPPLKLSESRRVEGADLPVTLYPHPIGRLGLVAVRGSGSWEDMHRISYDAAMPVLDELSARYDVPIPVIHVMSVGMPSGLIHLYYPSPPKEKAIGRDDEILPWCPHPELRATYALYREAVSSNNPFHAFLTFWKVWEEALYVRNERGARLKRSDTRVREEVFPDQFAFGAKPEELADPSRYPDEEDEERLRGQPFSKARDVLNGPYRVALAHAGRVDAGQALTGATFEHYERVADKVPVIRYVANVVLENIRATFDADRKREVAETAGGAAEGSGPKMPIPGDL